MLWTLTVFKSKYANFIFVTPPYYLVLFRIMLCYKMFVSFKLMVILAQYT